MGQFASGPLFLLALFCFLAVVTAVGATLEALLTRRTSRDTGTPPERGSWKLSASTSTRERGTRTPGTATTEGCSSSTRPGVVLGDRFVQTLPPLVSSFSAPGLSGVVMEVRGVSGVQQGRVV